MATPTLARRAPLAQPPRRTHTSSARCAARRCAAAQQAAPGEAASRTVLVTGAGGRTGSLVFEQLLADGRYSARGLVSSEASKAKLVKRTACEASAVFVGDVTDPAALEAALEGVDAVVVLTSAVPSLKKRSLLPFLVRNKLMGDKSVRLGFRWKRGQTPEEVDYKGGVQQVDAAVRAGVRKLVWVGSMGGCDESNFLNTIGADEGDDKSGKILVWKRKAEMHLAEQEALDYTIVHPGGLTKDAGGEREIVVGVDDSLLKRKYRAIPRADVATVVVQCIDAPEASNMAFDVCTNKPEEGTTPTTGIAPLLAGLEAYDYSIAVPTI